MKRRSVVVGVLCVVVGLCVLRLSSAPSARSGRGVEGVVSLGEVAEEGFGAEASDVRDPGDAYHDASPNPPELPSAPRGYAYEASPDEGAFVEVALEGLSAGAQTLTSASFRVLSCLGDACAERLARCGEPEACPEDFRALAVADGRGDFLYLPQLEADAGPTAAAEVNAYVHLTRALGRYAAFGVPPVMEPITVILGDIGFPGGALLRGGRWFILLGRWKGRQIAYDPDALAHELAHVLLNLPNVVIGARGYTGGPEALGEGSADYMSSVVSSDALVGEYSLQKAARNLGIVRRCPDSLVGEPHGDGLIWGSALWRLGLLVGSEVLVPALWRALSTLPRGVSLQEAAQSLSAELHPLVDPQTHAQVEAVFEAQGLFACDPVVSLNVGEARSLFLPGLAALERGFPEGLKASLEMLGLLGPIQLKVTLPQGAQALKVNVFARGQAPLTHRVWARFDQPIGYQEGALGFEVLSDAGSHAGQALVVSLLEDTARKATVVYIGLTNLARHDDKLFVQVQAIHTP